MQQAMTTNNESQKKSQNEKYKTDTQSGDKIEENKLNSNGKDKCEIKMKEKITLVNGITIIAGTIIGAGIFVSPKGVYENCGGSPLIALIIWCFCGIFSMLGALCYAELGTSIKKSGGEYTYIMECYGELPAFLYLWVSMLIIGPTTRTITALAFSFYTLSSIYPDCMLNEATILLMSACCLCLLTFINCISIRWTMHIQDLFTAAKLLALSSIVFMGTYNYFINDFSNLNFSEKPDISNLKYSNLAFAVYSGLFAYGGWNSLNSVTDELKNPYKNLPRSTIAGTLLVTFFYVMVNMAYFIILTPDEVLNSPTIATVFATKTMKSIAFLMPIAVAFSTFGGLNGVLFTASRVFCAGANQGQVPIILGMINTTKLTPAPSLILSCFLSLAMLITADVYQLINYFSFALWMWTGVATSTLIYLRIYKPKLHRPIKYHISLHIFFTLSCLILTLFSFWAQPLKSFIGTLITLIGIPFYYIFKKKNVPTSEEKNHSITKFLQCLLMVILPENQLSEKVNL